MAGKTNKFISVLLCAAVFTVFSCFYCVHTSALSSEIQGNTVCEVLGINPRVYFNWLLSHQEDDYYLGTPYKPGDYRNPNGDCGGAYGSSDSKGTAAMNCTGFVWHVLTTASGLSGGDSSSLPAMSGWVSFYTNNNISRRYFNSKEEMLNSGYLEKGDLIWMFENSEYTLSNYNHVGIYWGNGTTDVLWHSSNQGYSGGNRLNSNVISEIIPAAQDAKLYLVLKAGASFEDTEGDFNLDGALTSDDVTILQSYLAGIISGGNYIYNFTCSDINRDGKTDILDVTLLQNMIAKSDLDK